MLDIYASMRKSDIIQKILDRIPIETKIKVLNEMTFITLICDLGYREDKMWDKSEDHILNKLMELANKHTDEILEFERAFIERFCLYLNDNKIKVTESNIDNYFKLK